MMLVYSCANFTQKRVLTSKSELVTASSIVKQYKVCRGKGYLNSKGSVTGKLSFYFTATPSKVYIHFNDILGRKTMIMFLNHNSVEAWDVIQNVRFSEESIYIRFPFFELIRPQDLISIFWGIEPTFPTYNNIGEKSSVYVTFSSNDFPLDAVHIEMNDENQTIDIKFEPREYGSSYPFLIKTIPISVPQAQL